MSVEKRQIGKYLKRFRETYHLKQKDVADRIAIHPQLYLKYERDAASPSANVIASIAQAYNVTADYLLGLSDTPRPYFDEREVREAFAIRDAYRHLQSVAGITA